MNALERILEHDDYVTYPEYFEDRDPDKSTNELFLEALEDDNLFN